MVATCKREVLVCLALILVIAVSVAAVAIRASRQQDEGLSPPDQAASEPTRSGEVSRQLKHIIEEKHELDKQIDAASSDSERRSILLAHRANPVSARKLLEAPRGAPGTSSRNLPREARHLLLGNA